MTAGGTLSKEPEHRQRLVPDAVPRARCGALTLPNHRNTRQWMARLLPHPTELSVVTYSIMRLVLSPDNGDSHGVSHSPADSGEDCLPDATDVLLIVVHGADMSGS